MTLLTENDTVAALDAQLEAIAKERHELVAAMPAYDATQAGNPERAAKIVAIQSRLGELDIAREKTVQRRRLVVGNLDRDVSAAAAKREHEIFREVKAVIESATAEMAELLADVRETRRGRHDIPTFQRDVTPEVVARAAVTGMSLVHIDPSDTNSSEWSGAFAHGRR